MQLQFPLNLHRNPSYLIILILVVHRNNTRCIFQERSNKNSAHLVGSRVALSFEPSLGWAAELSINGWHSSAATPKPEQKVERLGIGWIRGMRVLITDRNQRFFLGAIARCGDANRERLHCPQVAHSTSRSCRQHATKLLEVDVQRDVQRTMSGFLGVAAECWWLSVPGKSMDQSCLLLQIFVAWVQWGGLVKRLKMFFSKQLSFGFLTLCAAWVICGTFSILPCHIVIFSICEVGFSFKDVEALCSLGASTKGLGQTGHKGVGFKASFVLSARPHVLSENYKFFFEERVWNECRRHLWSDERNESNFCPKLSWALDQENDCSLPQVACLHIQRVQRHPWDWQLLLNEILSPSVFQIFLLEVTPEVLPSGLTLPRKAPVKGTAMYLPLRRAFPSDLLGELHPSTLLFLRQLVVCTWWRWLRCLSHLRYCFHRFHTLLCRAGSRRLKSITVENERETPCHCYTYVLSKSSQDHRIDVVTCKKIKSDGEDLPMKEEEKGWWMLMGYRQGRIFDSSKGRQVVLQQSAFNLVPFAVIIRKSAFLPKSLWPPPPPQFISVSWFNVSFSRRVCWSSTSNF